MTSPTPDGSLPVGKEERPRPLAIDLFCGLGGWTEGLLAEGYDVIGFDIEEHVYGEDRYPGKLVIQDVLTLRGSQFKDAALIVASPPCQAYSYRAMPWKRAKALPPPCNALFDACFRIQREASEAAGRPIPMVVENVKGAQPWVGRKHKDADGYERSHPNAFGWKIPRTSSGSVARKRASALVAKIPLPLSQHIARTFKPYVTPPADGAPLGGSYPFDVTPTNGRMVGSR